MRSLLLTVILLPLSTQAQIPTSVRADSLAIRSIHTTTLVQGDCYDWLRDLCALGPRLSGSVGSEKAVAYTKSIMDTLGLDRVWLQPVMVPHWVRGDQEQAHIIGRRPLLNESLTLCALGGSVSTGDDGISAQVVEVHSYDELRKMKPKDVEGKIVFFNVPMNQAHLRTFHAYGETARYRVFGADSASKKGAVAMVLRSLSTSLDDYPHTGVMVYRDTTVPHIPGAALSTVAAERLSAALREDPKLKLHIRMTCETLPDVVSYNVIGEIRGTEKPDEIIVVGGHLDAWDNGAGAHDDGAGCMQSIQVLQTFLDMGYAPKRTVRAVMYMNEENGARGGREYARVADSLDENHIFAIESDAGGFTPRGFGIDSVLLVRINANWGSLLGSFGLHELTEGGHGVDIGPLKEHGCLLAGLNPDSQRYFDYHHAPSDTFDKVNHRELKLGAAAMASLVYLVAEYGVK
jgi:hypothetical protein